jgi:selenocysteine lyase/cysteine desulfurase
VILNLLGMKAAASLFVDLGIRNIQRHNHALIDRLVAYLRPRPFYTITSSLEKKHRSSIFSFTCPGYKELYDRITKSRIILSEREGSIRISAHLFNNEDDIDRLIAVLDDFSRRRA